MIVTIKKSAYINAQGLFLRMVDDTQGEIRVGREVVRGELISKLPQHGAQSAA